MQGKEEAGPGVGCVGHGSFCSRMCISLGSSLLKPEEGQASNPTDLKKDYGHNRSRNTDVNEWALKYVCESTKHCFTLSHAHVVLKYPMHISAWNKNITKKNQKSTVYLLNCAFSVF